MTTSHYRRLRSGTSTFLLIAFSVLAIIATSCSPATVTVNGERTQDPAPIAAATGVADESEERTERTAADSAAASDATNEVAADEAAALPAPPEPTPTPHPIAVADTELPQAPIGFDNLFDTAPSGPQPISIEIENINVRDAAIIPVGVNQEDLSFEVPPADQVGWYEYGSSPGEAGSAVLAAHIAFNGVDGVFRYLENVEVGAIVAVGFDDGSTLRYRIEDVTEYNKEALPDSIWARDGREQLALITCGGAFNYELDSYESNTVAIAVPI